MLLNRNTTTCFIYSVTLTEPLVHSINWAIFSSSGFFPGAGRCVPIPTLQLLTSMQIGPFSPALGLSQGLEDAPQFAYHNYYYNVFCFLIYIYYIHFIKTCKGNIHYVCHIFFQPRLLTVCRIHV